MTARTTDDQIREIEMWAANCIGQDMWGPLHRAVTALKAERNRADEERDRAEHAESSARVFEQELTRAGGRVRHLIGIITTAHRHIDELSTYCLPWTDNAWDRVQAARKALDSEVQP